MEGYFFKKAKFEDEDEDLIDVGDEKEDIELMDDPTLKTLILNEISRANDTTVDEISSALKLHLGLAPELQEQHQASYQKVQFIVKNLDNLESDQLIAITKSLVA